MSGSASESASMQFDVFIPARYGSRRLPGKPLIPIRGKPLIQYVYDCASSSSAARVVVVTDDERIEQTVLGFGGEVFVTRSDHPTGTDRIAEAAVAMGLADDRIIVNVQGDEPQMPPSLIDEVARALVRQPQLEMSTASYPFTADNQENDPNVVKVVTNAEGSALYFSRAPIPWSREKRPVQAQHHIGIYAYRVALLKAFLDWERSEMELVEQLEQLRVLYHGGRIFVHQAAASPGVAVDTRQDLINFENSLATV